MVKLLEETQGIGVVLAETRQAAERLIDSFRGLKVQFLVQKFITEADGRDVRCLVIGGTVVAAIECQAKAGDDDSRGDNAGPERGRCEISCAQSRGR